MAKDVGRPPGPPLRHRLASLAAVALLSAPFVPTASHPRPPDDNQVVLAFTGDVLIHTGVTRSAARLAAGSGARYDFGALFADVAPVISAADLAVCHLEVTLGVPGVESAPFPRLAAPAAAADGLAEAGFDECDTASNHALDYGAAGVASTISALDSAGLLHTGTATSPPDLPGVIVDLGPLRLGHLSYSYGFNGSRPDSPYEANLIDPDRIAADAASLRAAGADIVVVSLHWGTQYRSTPTAFQIGVAKRLEDSGMVDLVVGHHAHVVQPVDLVGNLPVAYGLGNFISNQTAHCCTVASVDGMILLVRLLRCNDRWSVAELAAVPTWVDHRAEHRIRLAVRNGADGQRLVSASATRTGARLAALGHPLPLLSAAEALAWMGSRRTPRLACGPPATPPGLDPLTRAS